MKNLFLFLFTLITLLFTSCSSDKIKVINENTPYAIQLKEIRSYYKAEDIKERFNKLGIKAYIISEELEDGNWYRIVAGAEKSLEEIREFQSKIEEKITIEDLEIINYQNIEKNLIVNFKDNLKETKRISSEKPNLPEKLFQIINKFPEDNNFIVQSFFVVNSPDSIKDLKNFKPAYELDHDLPRGVSLKNLMKKSTCIAEVIYEDNIFGDQVTIDIATLKDDPGIELSEKRKQHAFEIANYFAELILETGKYNFEDKVKINISSYQKFQGYKVTIQPKKRKESYRTYFVLVSKDLRSLVFSQSTEKSDDEILEIIQDLGKSEGLNSYDEFHNAFYTLPKTCYIEDEFICFSSEKLSSRYARDRNYAKWSKKMVGHWNSTASFYSPERRSWSVSFFDLLNYEKVSLIHENLYVKAHKSNSNSKEVNMYNDKIGIIFKGKYPTELSFPGNRFVVAINNGYKGKLQEGDLIDVAECLQLK